MNNQFIPYELALELKELGFDEPCLAYFEGHAVMFGFDDATTAGLVEMTNSKYTLSSPLWQQAFNWFRERYKLHSTISLPINKVDFAYEITNISEFIEEGQLSSMQSGIIYTYEEARLECLKKLIEIVKNK